VTEEGNSLGHIQIPRLHLSTVIVGDDHVKDICDRSSSTPNHLEFSRSAWIDTAVIRTP